MSDRLSDKNTFKGENFVFHLFNDHGQLIMGLSSDYVYPYVEKDELKKLAEFILKYLEQN